MKRHVTAAVLCSVAAFQMPAVAAEETTWVEIADTTSSVYSGKKGSFEISQTKGNMPIGVIRGQVYDKAAKRYEYQQWYVSRADCLNNMGKVVILDTSGQFKFEADFISEGNSAASAIGDLVCSLYQSALNEQESKSI